MNDSTGRKFEVASDGSDTTELLCKAILEPRADELIGGEGFKESGIMVASTNIQLGFIDDAAIEIEFTARVSGVEPDTHELGVTYNICVSFLRSRNSGELWPVDEAEDDDEIDYDEGTILLVENDDSDPVEVALSSIHMVQEVWDYYVDDETYEPRKDLRYEYYNANGTLLGVLGIDSGRPSKDGNMLSEDPEEDIALQINDALFEKSFSELDIALLEAVCRQDVMAIRQMIEEIGGWEGQDKFEDDEVDDSELKIEVDEVSLGNDDE
ncbi:MAG: hypothetical protein ABIQ89_03460 [Candidatus Saccharimonadales bacterium]